MATPVELIKNFVDALTKTTKTGTDAVNEALTAVGITGDYSSLLEEFDSKGSILEQNFLEQVCGVRLNNSDTGAITGSDAGGSTTKTAESIVPENGTATELTDSEYNSFTKNGLTVNVTYNEDYVGDTKLDVDKQKLVTRALYNWWVPESLDIINESLGLNFTDGRANLNEINVKFSADPGTFSTGLKLDIDYDLGRASNVTLTFGYDLVNALTAADKNGTLAYGGQVGTSSFWSAVFATNLDQLVLQALAEVALRANVSYVNDLPQPIARGLAEIVGGYDGGMTSLSFVTSQEADKFGYALVRYLAKNYSTDDTSTTDTSTTDTGQVISNYAGEPVTVSGFTGANFSGNNFVVNSSTGGLTIENVTDKIVDIRDSAGGEFLKAYQASTAGVVDGRGIAAYEIIEGAATGMDVILAGEGGSQLWGGSGNSADAIAGGNGIDIFIGGRYQGSDVFYNASSADFVNLTDATLSDIVGTLEDNGNIAIGFNTGEIVTIQSTELLSAAINLADGSSWRFNHVTKSWQIS